jgi:hypothetical protein
LLYFKKKTIGPVSESDARPDSAIERMERVDGKLILQGAEDGYEPVRDGLGRSHEPNYFSTRWNTNVPNILSEA